MLSWIAWSMLAVLGLALGATLGAGVLLGGRAPLDVTGLARTAIRWSAPPRHGWRIGRLAVHWAVLRDGIAAPLELAITDASLPGEAGLRALDIGTLHVALRTAPLLRGAVRPVALQARNVRVVLAPPSAGARHGGGGGTSVPPIDEARRVVGSLRSVDLRALSVATNRPALGVVAVASLRGERANGAAGVNGAASLAITPDNGPTVPVTLQARPAAGAGTAVALAGGPVAGARLAVLAPALAAIDAPVSVRAETTLDRAGRPGPVRIALDLGAGWLQGGGGRIPVTGVRAAARVVIGPGGPAAGNGTVELRSLEARLGGTDRAAGPVLDATGTLAGDWRNGGTLAGALHVTLDRVPAPALGRYWPPAAAHDARQWITENIPVGIVSGGVLDLGLGSGDGAGALAVTTIRGGFDATGLAVHWLRPVAPITGAAGHVAVLSADRVVITLDDGHQGGLAVGGSRMTITGLSGPTQIGTIDVRASGSLASMLAVLATPRLGLLERAPISFDHPSGRGTVDLAVTLPLDARVRFADIGIKADAALSAVHLGNVAAGLALDQATLALRADTAALGISGTGLVATVPVTLRYQHDFAAGRPDTVEERAHVTAAADAAALARAGLPTAGIFGGTAALALDYALRRNGGATLDLAADLRRATVSVPLAWRKDAGADAELQASLRLDHGRLVAIDRLRADGPGLRVVARGEIGADGGVHVVRIDQLDLGRTVAAGRITLPPRSTGVVAVALHGASLDLAPVFARRPGEHATGHPTQGKGGKVGTSGGSGGASGPRWTAALGFDRVLLPQHGTLHGVSARGTGRGTVPVSATLRIGGPSPAQAVLAPDRGGSTLAVRADDAGALLAATGLSDEIAGGRLALDGRFAGPVPAAKFNGHLAVDTFTLRRAPWAARLLRDLTVYGLFGAQGSAHGKSSLAVTRLDAPLGFDNGVLTLTDARVWQPALGLTGAGTIDTGTDQLDLRGTVVPAYAINAIPGRIPLIGRLFSPEKGGGLFAATWRVRGSTAKPTVSVNPLAALVPGVLRALLPP